MNRDVKSRELFFSIGEIFFPGLDENSQRRDDDVTPVTAFNIKGVDGKTASEHCIFIAVLSLNKSLCHMNNICVGDTVVGERMVDTKMELDMSKNSVISDWSDLVQFKVTR